MSAAKPANRPGCYKCGQQGHWARDCQAPKESWLPRDFDKGATQQQQQPGGDAEAQQAAAPAEEAVPMGAAAAARASRKRPKLTFDDLKKPAGLPELYHNFPEAFRRQFRGRGHEAADLRRLLEMYSRWQGRVFPHGSLDNFIAALEKIGAANVVKREMSDMRMDLLRGVEDKLRGEGRGGDAEAETEDAAAEVAAVVEDEPLLAIDSDDELLELAAMPLGAEGAAGRCGAAEAPPGDLDDDEELLALAAMQDGGGGGAGAACAPPVAGEGAVEDLDDEELLALAADL